MLVLSRKMEEKIRIGDEIVVTVLRIKGNTVKIGIDAPRAVRVVRSELPPVAEATSETENALGEPAEEPDAAVAIRTVRPVTRTVSPAPLGRYENVIAQAMAK